MMRPRIQLLVFEGCPLADAARHSLQRALAELGIERYEELDLLSPETPETLRGWGSPTILVDGRDLAGGSKGDDVGCRVYAGPENVPTSDDIKAAIVRAQ